MPNTQTEEKILFGRDELDAWSPYVADHFLDVLNGETTIEEARENLASFRKTEHYTGSEDKYKL